MHRRLASLLLVGVLFNAAPMRGQEVFQLTRVVDTATVVPGGSGSFSNLIDAFTGEGMVGFYGAWGSNQRGVYLYNGSSITRVADYSTMAPGGSQAFSEFQNQRGGILDGAVYFHGAYSNQSGTWSGIYRYDSGAGSLTRVTGRGVAYPAYDGAVDQVGYVFARGGNVTFSTSRTSPISSPYGSNGGGYFRTSDGAALSVPVDSSQSGGQPFGIGPFATNGTRIVLQEIHTLYSFDGSGGLVQFNLTNYQVPGFAFNFSGGVGALPALTADDLFFTANIFSQNVRGLYRINPDGTGSVSSVVDSSTLFPGTLETFNFFGAIAASDNAVAFIAHSASARGVFLYRDGVVSTILDNLAPFDGRTIASFSMGDAALSAEGLAFRAVFTDGSQAIYYANLAAIPEPSTWALLAGGLALGAVVGRRHWRGNSRSAKQ